MPNTDLGLYCMLNPSLAQFNNLERFLTSTLVTVISREGFCLFFVAQMVLKTRRAHLKLWFWKPFSRSLFWPLSKSPGAKVRSPTGLPGAVPLSQFKHHLGQVFSGKQGARLHCCKAAGMCAHALTAESQHWSWKQLCSLHCSDSGIGMPMKTGLTQLQEALCWCSFPGCCSLWFHQAEHPPAAGQG